MNDKILVSFCDIRFVLVTIFAFIDLAIPANISNRSNSHVEANSKREHFTPSKREMLDYDQFMQRYAFKEGGKTLSDGTFGSLYEGIDNLSGKPVLIKVSRPETPDYLDYPDDLILKQGPMLRQIRKIFASWFTHVIGANSGQSPKIEGMAMKLDKGPVKGKMYSIAVRSYMAFERMESSLKARHLDPNPKVELSFPDYQDLGKTLVELLAFFKEENMVHGDLNALNLMYALDWDIKLVDFGIGKLLEEDLVQPIRVRSTHMYCHPLFEQTQMSNDMEDMHQNDKFCAGMVMLHLGTLCEPESLRLVKEASQISLQTLREAAVELFTHIEENYDKKYVTVIERLLTNDRIENILKFIASKGGQIDLDECEDWWNTVVVPNPPWVELHMRENSLNFRK